MILFTYLFAGLFAIAAHAKQIDPYAILGVLKTDKQKTITSAYRKLVIQFHPDKNPSPEAADKIREINAAYEILGDEEKRAEFDRYGDLANETLLERLERMEREGTLDYFTARELSKLRWENRPKGSSFEHAKADFELQSYYASENIDSYELTSEQRLEFARIAAKNHGSVFSSLVRKFKLPTPQERFEVGMIAALNDHWSNVKFDLKAFALEQEPKLKFELAKAVLTKNSYSAKFLREWNFPTAQVFQLLKLVADQRGNGNVAKYLIVAPLSEQQRFEIAKIAARRDLDQFAEDFSKYRITDAKLLDLLFESTARVNGRFGKYARKFGIRNVDRLRELAEIALTYPKRPTATEFLGPEHFNLNDEDLITVYYKHVRPRRYYSDPLEDLLANRGISRPSHMVAYGDPLDPNSYTVEKARAAWSEYRQLAKKHPRLLPEQWLDVAEPTDILEPDISVELLRALYGLSNENQFYMPSSSIEILCQAVHLPCKDMKVEEYSPTAIKKFFRFLLPMHEFITPAFFKVKVDPSVFDPAHIDGFIRLLATIREGGVPPNGIQVHGIGEEQWKSWKRKLKLSRSGIHPENLEKLIERVQTIGSAAARACEERLAAESAEDELDSLERPQRLLPAN